jgi:hypothetical protein
VLRILIQCFENGQVAGVSLGDVRESFGRFLIDPGPGMWQVRYDDANYCDMRPVPLESDESRIASLGMEGACTDPRLWDALFAILKLGNVVMRWPGSGPVVAEASVVEHLPPELIKASGPPAVVHRGADIAKLIQP